MGNIGNAFKNKNTNKKNGHFSYPAFVCNINDDIIKMKW